MEWSGKDGFNAANDEAWIVNGENHGELRTYENFQFLRVYEAGHMVSPPCVFFWLSVYFCRMYMCVCLPLSVFVYMCVCLSLSQSYNDIQWYTMKQYKV